MSNNNSLNRWVDHTYRDYSQYVNLGGELIKHKKSDRNFPAKLHHLVSDPKHSRAITWMVRMCNLCLLQCISLYGPSDKLFIAIFTHTKHLATWKNIQSSRQGPPHQVCNSRRLWP